ncbi:MAG: MtrB/PioB family outer membrane beta-barrel protein, partial [Nitrospirota bacterium]
LSSSRIDFDTFNPNGPVKLANAAVQDWGKVKNRLHQFKADLGYKISKNIKAGIRYLYEKYKLDDFAWDDMRPYMAGVSAENSTKFLFTDATYNGYEAHVGGVYITYKF